MKRKDRFIISNRETESKEIFYKKKEIEKLKRELKLKEDVFLFLRSGKRKKAVEIIAKKNYIKSYFLKFRDGNYSGKVITGDLDGDFAITYNPIYENDISEDLERLRRDIEEKENRLEQKFYLQKQQEYLKNQTLDIEEGKKDRRQMQNFTFILAFGVIVTLMFNWFQVFTEVEYAKTSNVLLIGGILMVFFAVVIIFLFYVIKAKHIKSFVFNWTFIGAVILAVAMIIFLVWLLLVVGNQPINQDDRGLKLFNESFQEYRKVESNQTIALNKILDRLDEVDDLGERLVLLEKV